MATGNKSFSAEAGVTKLQNDGHLLLRDALQIKVELVSTAFQRSRDAVNHQPIMFLHHHFFLLQHKCYLASWRDILQMNETMMVMMMNDGYLHKCSQLTAIRAGRRQQAHEQHFSCDSAKA